MSDEGSNHKAPPFCIKLDGRSNHHFTLARKSIKKRENNDACGSYLGHPRVGVSSTDPYFLKVPPLQIGFSLVLLKKTDDECGNRVCRSTTACGATS